MKGTDEECMIAYQAGDITGFNELYRRYSARVYGFMLHRIKSADQASDLLQATFLKLHATRSRYLPRYPLVAWIFTIARSVFLDHVRAAQVRPSTVPFEAGVHDPIHLDRKESGSLDLSGLEPEQRELLRLRFEEDLPFEEIARRLEVEPATARQRLSRALKRLKLLFVEGGER